MRELVSGALENERLGAAMRLTARGLSVLGAERNGLVDDWLVAAAPDRLRISMQASSTRFSVLISYIENLVDSKATNCESSTIVMSMPRMA